MIPANELPSGFWLLNSGQYLMYVLIGVAVFGLGFYFFGPKIFEWITGKQGDELLLLFN